MVYEGHTLLRGESHISPTGLGAAKIGRLETFGIDTVERLAAVNVQNNVLCQLVTLNKRRDRAVTTVCEWRDRALLFLGRRWASREIGLDIPDPTKKRRRPVRRRRRHRKNRKKEATGPGA